MNTTTNAQSKNTLQLMQQALHEIAILDKMFDAAMARIESKLVQPVAA